MRASPYDIVVTHMLQRGLFIAEQVHHGHRDGRLVRVERADADQRVAAADPAAGYRCILGVAQNERVNAKAEMSAARCQGWCPPAR